MGTNTINTVKPRGRLDVLLGVGTLALALGLGQASAQQAALPPAGGVYTAVGETARPPIGWVEFCASRPGECGTRPIEARDVRLSAEAWKDLARVNDHVNQAIRPMTDLEHHGVAERWSYPDSGYGDCEDYVLLKRRILMQAGWPRSALLITVVRDQRDEGHAVLTVRTDRGEFILDNQNPAILPWHETGYRYVKRQSQTDPNLWVALGENRPRTPTVASEKR